jgi:hypothetical protein
MLQKIEVSLQSLVARQQMPPEVLAWVTNQVNLFFGSFRKADADDPETFHAGCTRLFSNYPPEVVQYVVDPVTGLSGRVEWLPPLAKVKQALDERAFYLAQIAEREERISDQLAERKRAEIDRKVRPTFEELQAKHGPNWGLKETAGDDEARKAAHRSLLADANRRAFEAECESAGVSPDRPISPSLAALIRKGK